MYRHDVGRLIRDKDARMFGVRQSYPRDDQAAGSPMDAFKRAIRDVVRLLWFDQDRSLL
jgi:hypothetical protein